MTGLKDKWETIQNVLSRFPDGVNFNRLAAEAEIKPSTLSYYIYGETKNNKEYGGSLKDLLNIKKCGNVTIISTKS